MKTEDLIADLASRATPVRPLPSPSVRTLGWLAVAIASAAAGVLVFGTRPNLASIVTGQDFLMTSVLALGTAGLSAAAALVLAVPGAERSALVRGLPFAVLGMWTLTAVMTVLEESHGLSGASDWYVCAIRVAAIGLVPAIVLVAMLRRAAPLRLEWTGAMALAGAAAVGTLAIQFICPVDDAGHALLGHLGPVLALAAAGAAAAARLFRRSSLA
jgi:hypothetical protein